MTRKEFTAAGGVIEARKWSEPMPHWVVDAEAPRNHVFASTGTHFVSASDETKAGALAQIDTDLAYGVEPCESDCECQGAMEGDFHG